MACLYTRIPVLWSTTTASNNIHIHCIISCKYSKLRTLYTTEPEPNMNDFSSTYYLTSAKRFEQCPADTGSEVAFAGRSNAGKSSALNVITDTTGLARTSKTPGRTQMINFFALDDDHRLVDLPGYGYAKVPKKIKVEWQKELGKYLEKRASLRGLILLMDVRHPLKEFDCEMLDWAHSVELPVHILLTKSDKLSNGPAGASLQEVLEAIHKSYPLCSAQLFSSLKKQGLKEARQVLSMWLYD